MAEQLKGSLQENLLTLLCFDTESAPLIIHSVDLGLFENKYYRTVAEKAKNFYIDFKRAIGDHLPDTLEKELGTDDDDSVIFTEVLYKLHDFKDSVNKDYVLKQLNDFVKEQSLKSALTESVKQVQAGNIEKAEHVLNEHRKQCVETFEAGIELNYENFDRIFRDDVTEVFKTGISVLDELNIGLARGELFIPLAPANRGKTSFLIHLGKSALLQRLKVLHITLEMSEEKVLKRYLQGIYAVTTRKKPVQARYLEANELGKFSGFRTEKLDRPALNNDADLAELKKKVKKHSARRKLRVKRFPTSSLTMEGLELYLDALETFENYTPDVLLLDYPDLMKMDGKNLREDTGKIYKELRGLGIKRNMAIAAPSQSNRASEDAKVITLKHFAEDYSKAAIADNVVAYIQTEDEYNLGLARLFVAKARDEQKFVQILITQAYDMGQFCLSSVRMDTNYWKEVENASGRPPEDSETERPKTQRRSSLAKPKLRS